MSGLSYFSLLILIQVSSGTRKVTGLIGHNVTLPCFYEAKTLGALSFCWGRQEVPSSKCSKTILSSAHGAVLSRESPRYQVPGPESEGDVSLTILGAQSSDAGVYGCRVEIPGWFNDQKVNIHLVMEEAPVEQPATTTAPTPTTATTYSQSPAVKDEMVTFKPESPKIEKIQSETNQASFPLDAIGVGNIGRMAVVFLVAITVIVAFLITRSALLRRTLQHLNSNIVENIYESVSLTKRSA